MDAVSGLKDRRHRADKRVGKKNEEVEHTFIETMNTWQNNVKAPVDNTWQISPLCKVTRA